MKRDSTVRAKRPSRQRLAASWASKDETSMAGWGAPATGTYQPRSPAGSFHSCPRHSKNHFSPPDPRLTSQLQERHLAHEIFTFKTSKQLPAAAFKPAIATCHTFPPLPTHKKGTADTRHQMPEQQKASAATFRIKRSRRMVCHKVTSINPNGHRNIRH